ncbi:MAG: DUF1844 domain-containing protein [Fimbriimonas sp.]|nr:DUF1844 domain-containing protein [Fimbriimonas sp.]
MAENETEKPTKPLSIYDILAILIEQLAAVAWQKMGLQPDSVTGKIEPDLAEAKVAIDVTASMVQQLESQLDEDDKRRLHSLLRDLRINYVQKSQAGSA